MTGAGSGFCDDAVGTGRQRRDERRCGESFRRIWNGWKTDAACGVELGRLLPGICRVVRGSRV